jgi:hypothetical protein
MTDDLIIVIEQPPMITEVLGSSPNEQVQIVQKGDKGDPGTDGIDGSGDKTYEHIQTVAASVWNITHNLGKYPSVTIVDSGGNTVEGAVVYVDLNQVTAVFSAPFGGKAECN